MNRTNLKHSTLFLVTLFFLLPGLLSARVRIHIGHHGGHHGGHHSLHSPGSHSYYQHRYRSLHHSPHQSRFHHRTTHGFPRLSHRIHSPHTRSFLHSSRRHRSGIFFQSSRRHLIPRYGIHSSRSGISLFSAAPSTGSEKTTRGTVNSLEHGWQFLESGHYGQAKAHFAHAANQSPREGLPKAGYALALNLNGNTGQAITAMRRAFRYDPEGLHYLPVSSSMQEELQNLFYHYQSRAESDPADTDARFMAAALAWFLGENGLAKSEIQSAVHAGDSSESTHNLRNMLG